MQLFILSVTQTLDNQTVLKDMFSKKNIWEALRRTGYIYLIIYYRFQILKNLTHCFLHYKTMFYIKENNVLYIETHPLLKQHTQKSKKRTTTKSIRYILHLYT